MIDHVDHLPAYRVMSAEERARTVDGMVKAYSAGKSIRDIAASVGRSYSWTHYHLGVAGVVFRTRGGPRKVSR